MNACNVFDIGPNMTSVLVLAGPTMSVVLIAVAGRIKGATQRTEQAVAALPVAVAEQVAVVNSGEQPIVGPTDIRNRPLGG